MDTGWRHPEDVSGLTVGAGAVLERVDGDGVAAEQSVNDEVVVQPRRSPPLRRILIVADAVAVGAGLAVSLAALAVLSETTFEVRQLALLTLVIGGLAGLALFGNGLYRRRICSVRSAEISRIGRTSVMLAVALGLMLLPLLSSERAVLGALLGLVAWFGLLTFERGVLREWIHAHRASGHYGAPVLVVGGSAASATWMANFLAENSIFGFEPRGAIVANRVAETSGASSAAAARDIADAVSASDATGVVLDAGSLTGSELSRATELLSNVGVHVHISSGLRGIDRRRITLSPLADETFLHVAPVGLSRPQAVVKRIIDVAVAAVVLFFAWPLLVGSSLVIWLQDRGPILFRQERVGHLGERFHLYKLRTMVVDAEAKRAELAEGNARQGPLFKLDHDPRVTRFGRFLRASSIDELPQLFNVLEGTMSIVGPRPALAEEVEQFDDKLMGRLSVKPGVTGLWQVEARDLPSFDLYRRYDLHYVQNWSIGFDLGIIARTVTVVALRGLRAIIPARLRSQPSVGLE